MIMLCKWKVLLKLIRMINFMTDTKDLTKVLFFHEKTKLFWRKEFLDTGRCLRCITEQISGHQNRNSSDQEPATFFCKGPNSYFRLSGPYNLCHNYSTLTSRKQPLIICKHRGCSCVPIRLYLWTLKCEFHINFTSHNIL